jgi:superfamily II DNA/RNA helicase
MRSYSSSTDNYFKRGNRAGRGGFISRDKYVAKAKDTKTVSIYVENTSFNDFEIDTKLTKNIEFRKYTSPTKIQAEAIPYLLKGKDLLGIASTGSGKTGAFLIPMIDKILKDRTQKCLVITPTRELAFQIQNELREFTRRMNVYSALVIGGANIRKQIYALERNPQFVIATPGRLKDLYERRKIRLDTFNNVILDEVDRMLDMGFIKDITLLISKLSQMKQSLFFSATMNTQAERIANRFLKNPIKVQTEKQSPQANVDQDIVEVTSVYKKLEILHELLIKEGFDKVLIFSRTKRGADKLSYRLRDRGFKVDAIHGDKTQYKRTTAITNFRTNRINILVATDVASRGIDIPDITHVINYDEPATYEDYIHRIGRTGRVGKKGKALTFVS